MSQTNNSNKKPVQAKKAQMISVIISVLAIVIVGVVIANKDKILNQGSKENSTKTEAQVVQNENGDLVIPVNDVTETANFYKVNVEGTDMEVLAIKASDGTVRTAFNTCQVCYDSGRGYYEQSGDNLVCQNCGNTFTADDVEVARGGCNPVPISAEYKQIDSDNITISADFLKEAKVIFENWKTN
jgi:uncharacterized membrane protein